MLLVKPLTPKESIAELVGRVARRAYQRSATGSSPTSSPSARCSSATASRSLTAAITRHEWLALLHSLAVFSDSSPSWNFDDLVRSWLLVEWCSIKCPHAQLLWVLWGCSLVSLDRAFEVLDEAFASIVLKTARISGKISSTIILETARIFYTTGEV
jgi:hypothetical protein